MRSFVEVVAQAGCTLNELWKSCNGKGILALPEDLFDDNADRSRSPTFFELHIKTLFQHAWSEAEHDLSYKPSFTLTRQQKRLVAFTEAQAWGADQQFAQLHTELNGVQETNS